MKAIRAILLAGFSLFCFSMYSQVSINPAFFTIDDSITVTFDAAISKPSGALNGASKVYMHSGVITTNSTSSSDWRYVKGNWGKDDGIGLMTSIGNNKWQLKYKPRAYYGVPSGETVLKIAFVFRNADGSKEGKDAVTGSDIFKDIPASGANLSVKITNPTSFPLISVAGSQVTIEGTSNKKCDNLGIYINDTLVNQASNDSLVSYTYTLAGSNRKWVKLIGSLSGITSRDSFYITVRPQNSPIGVIPSGWRDGINYLSSTSVGLVLYAPAHSYVYVIGDFNNWETDNNYIMKQTPDSKRFFLQIDNLTPGKEYIFQYWVDGSIKIGDPYADKIVDPWNDKFITSATYPNLIAYPEGKTGDYASVFQTNQTPYNWKNTSFTRPSKNNLNIYELLVRDFSYRHSYQAIIDSIWYLKKLGINCVELMPIMEFEGNESWGYNVAYYFAPDKYYGPKDKLKELIDTLHANGIAVVLDMVLNHSFGSNPNVRLWWDANNNKPASNSPYYNTDAKHPFNVGYDFNHESQDTRRLVDTVLHYWLQEYKFDGFRFDLSKGFTQKNSGADVGVWGNYDGSRIYNLKRMYDYVKSYDQNVYMILEHFADNSEETELANYGMMPWGRMNEQYYEIAMGWNTSKTDLNWGYYKNRNWGQNNLITMYENHDEERAMYQTLTYGNSSGSYNAKNLSTAIERQKAVYAFLACIPGPKMTWMFGELGYDYSINFNGRVGNKPVRWDYYTDAARNSLFKNWAALNEFRTKYNLVASDNLGGELNTLKKRITLSDGNMNAVLIGNFDVTSQGVVPNFQKAGWWYDYISGDSINISNTSDPINLAPGTYKLYIDKKLETPSAFKIDTTGNIGITPIEENTATAYIYPNPAQKQVQIVYSVHQSQNVKIDIYSANGSHVAQLLNAQMNAGEHRLDIPVFGKYAPGLYLIKIEEAGHSQTLKLLVE